MLVNDFTNVSKKFCMLSKIVKIVFFSSVFLRNSDIFCDVCDCGLRWFGYEWGVSSGGFQSICCCFCRRNCTYVLRNDFTWVCTGDFTCDFIWGVLDTFLGLYLRVLLRCYVKPCTSISISIYLYKHINWIYIIIGESTKGIYIGSWL